MMCMRNESVVHRVSGMLPGQTSLWPRRNYQTDMRCNTITVMTEWKTIPFSK